MFFIYYFAFHFYSGLFLSIFGICIFSPLLAVLLVVFCATCIVKTIFIFRFFSFFFSNNSCGQSIVMHSHQTTLRYLSPCNFCRWKHSLTESFSSFFVFFIPQTLKKTNKEILSFHSPLNLLNIPFDDSINFFRYSLFFFSFFPHLTSTLKEFVLRNRKLLLGNKKIDLNFERENETKKKSRT